MQANVPGWLTVTALQLDRASPALQEALRLHDSISEALVLRPAGQ